MWHLSSRVHPLNHFPNEGVTCYAKRDDELGCGISGTKLRKYSSLIPWFLAQGIKHLVLIAGPQSNNLLAALQLAREFNLKVTAFLIKPWNQVHQGNFKLSSLFLEEGEIIWVPREQWGQVNAQAQAYVESLGESGFVLHEGASVPQALAGAMSLALDIQNNEKTLGLTFQHIFIDAGTGFSAAALIKGLNDAQHTAQVHVVLLADPIEVFQEKIQQWCGDALKNYTCFQPSTARAFGSVNRTIENEIKRLAREEGILADPIYAAKLFYEARGYIKKKRLGGNVLIVHSGGTLTLAGFSFKNKIRELKDTSG